MEFKYIIDDFDFKYKHLHPDLKEAIEKDNPNEFLESEQIFKENNNNIIEKIKNDKIIDYLNNREKGEPKMVSLYIDNFFVAMDHPNMIELQLWHYYDENDDKWKPKYEVFSGLGGDYREEYYYSFTPA